MKFSIYSASQSLHLLVVQSCVLGTCTEKALHLSRPNVEKFRAVLADFGRGELGRVSDDAIYRQAACASKTNGAAPQSRWRSAGALGETHFNLLPPTPAPA